MSSWRVNILIIFMVIVIYGSVISAFSRNKTIEQKWDGYKSRKFHKHHQKVEEDIGKTKVEDPSLSTPGTSLVFVFDTTGSMNDELMQVKLGATQILAKLIHNPELAIRNFVFVPFGDPGVGEMTVTDDDWLFRERMEDILVAGGGDCPEMTLTAIYTALLAALPSAHVYVFTDATAKDYSLLPQVLALVQRKEPTITFILTGTCSEDFSKEGYEVYEKIAATSLGQVYNLRKSEVKEVLKYVKFSLQRNTVRLLSSSHPKPQSVETPDKHEVIVDDTIKEFTVAVSGKNASVSVSDPEGIHFAEPPQLEKLLNLKNVKIVNVKEPHPGRWQVFVNSDSNYTVRSTGLSGVSFKHGFVIDKIPSIAMNGNKEEIFSYTNRRPLKGAHCILLIQVSDSALIYNLTDVQLVDVAGNRSLINLNLVPTTVDGLYQSLHFVPPEEFFHLFVLGFGKDGSPIRRITSTAISAQMPEKPILTVKNKHIGWIHHQVLLRCHVESLVPYSVHWLKNGVDFGFKTIYKNQTDQILLVIEKADESSNGNYTCFASNVAGNSTATISFTVTGPVPSVETHSKISASINETLTIGCNVSSALSYKVRWTQFTAKDNQSGVLHPVTTGSMSYQNWSLIIPLVQPEDEGWFVCTAENAAGSSHSRVLLLVRDPLQLQLQLQIVPQDNKDNKTETFTSVSSTGILRNFFHGDGVVMTCTAFGRPTPRLEWRYNNQRITNDYNNGVDPALVYLQTVNDQLRLTIDFLTIHWQGIYSCVASNDVESVSSQVELVYVEKPKVSAMENNMMVRSGAEIELQCTSSTGKPHPTFTWYKDGINLVDISQARFQVNEGKLLISSAQASDAGEYKCRAENGIGFDEDHIGLFVGSPPLLLHTPRNKKIQLYHNGTIACSVIGSPSPDIKWVKANGNTINTDRIIQLGGGGLRFTLAQPEDDGMYTCVASNVFGTATGQVKVTVTGMEKPRLDEMVAVNQVMAVVGSDVTLPCGLSRGNPPGQVYWFFLNNTVSRDNMEDVNSLYLTFSNVQAHSQGLYTCTVVNPSGNTTHQVHLFLQEPPQILFNNGTQSTNGTSMKVSEGGQLLLSCPTTGSPAPTISWYRRHGTVLSKNFGNTIMEKGGNLIIHRAQEEDTGVYTCVATNEHGSASADVSLMVLVPPIATGDQSQQQQQVVEGHVVVLDCRVHAVPTPNVTWFKDDQHLPDLTSTVRIAATVNDSGIYTCFVKNEAGNLTKEFNVTVLVPPRANNGEINDERVIVIQSGKSVTLRCNVTGLPQPTILWQRNGIYLTRNSSEFIILPNDHLLIARVTEDNAGAYICDAENPAGVIQRIIYLQVHFPPRILNEDLMIDNAVNETASDSNDVVMKQGDEFLLSCAVEGNPRPLVVWRKDGLLIRSSTTGILMMEDNTLVFLQAQTQHSGVYECVATNDEGVATKKYILSVVAVPEMDANKHINKHQVPEGESLILVCPVSHANSAATSMVHVQWTKNGLPLPELYVERSDEAPIRTSKDKRTLYLGEAHPADSGNYTCVASNAAGRTDASFLVDVLMVPHFDEFNHQAQRTVTVGATVALNCSVSGNPQPQVTWRKDGAPLIAIGEAFPGVHLLQENQYLEITNGRLFHTGTYTCSATNQVATKEREFYVTVLEPPVIAGNGYNNSLEVVEVNMGSKVVLECPVVSGTPEPAIVWFKTDDVTGNKLSLNVSDSLYETENANCSHVGTYICEASNTAGIVSKTFYVSVLEPAIVEGEGSTNEVEATVGSSVRIECTARGQPLPRIKWLHNGRDINNTNSNITIDHVHRSRRSNNIGVSSTLLITNVDRRSRGVYTAIASNRAGASEKHFQLVINIAPYLIENVTTTTTTNSTGGAAIVKKVLLGQYVVVRCPVDGSPKPNITWSKFNDNQTEVESDMLIFQEAELSNEGVYVCLASNRAGNLSVSIQLIVEFPPRFNNELFSCDVETETTATLICEATGNPLPTMLWLSDNGQVISHNETLIVDGNKVGGGEYIYTCVASNAIGSSEKDCTVTVLEAPKAATNTTGSRYVLLNRRVALACNIYGGYPKPQIEWFHNGMRILNESSNNVLILNDGLELVILTASEITTSGYYKCVATNRAGSVEIIQQVIVQVMAYWSPWTEWSACSVSCGIGIQQRTRSCSAASAVVFVNKTRCEGMDKENRSCVGAEECNDDYWTDWSPCSVSCGGGKRSRTRICVDGDVKCTSLPAEQVVSCFGETKTCELNYHYESWSKWEPCSATCGTGFRRRIRRCKLMRMTGSRRNAPHRRASCKRDDIQLESCEGPVPCMQLQSAHVHVRGHLNGQPVDDTFDAAVDNEKSQINLNFPHVDDRSEDDILSGSSSNTNMHWLPYSPFMLAPLAWTAAREQDRANNGISLTKGRFLTQSNIDFVSGESLSMTHTAHGIDPTNGSLHVQIEVAGEVPLIEPSASLVVQPPPNLDLVQISNDTVYTYAEHDLYDLVRNRRLGVPFSYNSSVHYDKHMGTMSYPVQHLSLNTAAVPSSSDMDLSRRAISLDASIKRGFLEHSKQCPPGFKFDSRHMLCLDIDECDEVDGVCLANQVCHNTLGSYKCECIQGYVKLMSGRCQDINECENKPPPPCQHSCLNTVGSFYCTCQQGFYLHHDGISCIQQTTDKMFNIGDELNDGHSTIIGKTTNWCDCANDAICMDLMTTWHCIDIGGPCPAGMRKSLTSSPLQIECQSVCDTSDCIASVGSYSSLQFISETIKIENDDGDRMIRKIHQQQPTESWQYQLMEGGHMFYIREMSNDHTNTSTNLHLHTIRIPHLNTLYRVVVEVTTQASGSKPAPSVHKQRFVFYFIFIK